MEDFSQFTKRQTIQNSSQEYLSLCKILFNESDLQACNSITGEKRASIQPSKDSGLFAYFKGITENKPGYSYLDAEKRYGNSLRKLQGAKSYLVGHGGCTKEDQRNCTKVNDKKQIPLKFDFIDDGFNLIGAFELYRESSMNQKLGSCSLTTATFGSIDSPLCSAFYAHQLLLTKEVWNLRHLKGFYGRFSNFPRFERSSCNP